MSVGQFKIEKQYAVESRGRGRPDFSMDIEKIKRGETYTQFEPRSDEKMKIFLAAYSAGHTLAVGATEALVDFETFLPATPYTSPVGWLADFREWMFTFNGAVRLDIVSGDFPTLVLECYPMPNYFTHTYEQIIFFDTRFWDPTAASSHDWTFQITNIDVNPTRGSVQIALILTDIGSHHPTEKDVKCPLCGRVNAVPLEETKIKCVGCGGTFFVPFFPGRTI